MIPTLQTGRLRLRAPVMADFAAYAAFLATDRARHMGGPLDERGAWGYFTNDVAQWTLFGFGGLMIEPRDGGAVLGLVSICHGPLFPETELGWFLYAHAEAQGYAFEATGAIRDWAFSTYGLTSLVSYVDPDNVRSARLAQRLGGVRDPDPPTPGGDPDLMFGHFPGAA